MESREPGDLELSRLSTFDADVPVLLYTSMLSAVSTANIIQGGPKSGTPFLYALTLPNINRFSKLFHCQNQEKSCNNTITKDPTTPQVCR